MLGGLEPWASTRTKQSQKVYIPLGYHPAPPLGGSDGPNDIGRFIYSGAFARDGSSGPNDTGSLIYFSRRFAVQSTAYRTNGLVGLVGTDRTAISLPLPRKGRPIGRPLGCEAYYSSSPPAFLYISFISRQLSSMDAHRASTALLSAGVTMRRFSSSSLAASLALAPSILARLSAGVSASTLFIQRRRSSVG